MKKKKKVFLNDGQPRRGNGITCPNCQKVHFDDEPFCTLCDEPLPLDETSKTEPVVKTIGTSRLGSKPGKRGHFS